MSTPSLIVTHPGAAHKDEFLACAFLITQFGVPIARREPTQSDLANTDTIVVDVGGSHDPALLNFDHHQFPADHPPVCALSLVLQYLDLYEEARKFCDWLEPAEHFDTRGPIETAKWLGVSRENLAKLNSPIDGTVLRAFAREEILHPGDLLWELMHSIGQDTLTYLSKLRGRLEDIAHHSQWVDLPGHHKALFLPRTDPPPSDPSLGVGRYIEDHEFASQTVATIYPDRRGQGYALSRFNDSALLDFTRISDEEDVHFAHNRGFVAKTSATDFDRLLTLLHQSFLQENEG
ncbi:MYG1 family protein [Roseibacillus ishigakijimensis]|uniref:MYG1 family protein n=1 Tax=Roseibacillus ishigakijimensis TaxID=454146 RepID=A0A934RTF6_9BACT|nr:MYG1 family protein [Roseibacillus ishigakijimensis]MBK1835316.1 MYG1 family protein [Roseibacillus ishigakijimensis]